MARKYVQPPVIGVPPRGYAGSSWDSLGLFGLTRSAVNSAFKPPPLTSNGKDAGGNLRMERAPEDYCERRFLPPESKIWGVQPVKAYVKPRVVGHIRKNGKLAIIPVCSYAKGRSKGAIRTGVIFSDEPYFADVETSPAEMVLEGSGKPGIRVGKSRVVCNEVTGETRGKFVGGVRSKFQAAKRYNIDRVVLAKRGKGRKNRPAGSNRTKKETGECQK